MEQRLRSRKKSFTLIETTLVLAIILIFTVIGLKINHNQKQSLDSAISSFDSFFKQAKTNNFLSGIDRKIIFNQNKIQYQNRELILNKQYKFDSQTLILKSNGYIAPTTINIYKNNQQIAKIIFSLGFGVYRIEK